MKSDKFAYTPQNIRLNVTSNFKKWIYIENNSRKLCISFS